MTSVPPIQLAYNKYEPDSGINGNLAPIIFIHGFSACKEYWGDCPQIVANATKRTVYAIDARNHGDTEWSEEANLEIYAADLIHFINHHRIHQAMLVGHSMGGITAMLVALQKPNLVQKVAIEDMSLHLPSETILNFLLNYISTIRKAVDLAPSELDEDGVKKFAMQQYLQSLPQKMLNKLQTNENYTSGISLRRDSNGRYKLKTNFERFERVLATGMQDNKPEFHGVFERPALFIYGELSEFQIVEDELQIKEHFPNAVFKSIEGATHNVHHDKPVEFVEELLKFFV